MHIHRLNAPIGCRILAIMAGVFHGEITPKTGRFSGFWRCSAMPFVVWINWRMANDAASAITYLTTEALHENLIDFIGGHIVG